MITILYEQRLVRLALTCFAIGAIFSSPLEPARAAGDEVKSSLTINRVQHGQLTASLDKICSLKIVFGSYATGIDPLAFGRIWNLLLRDREVSEVFVIPWGREGEVTLCVKGLKRNADRRLFSAVKVLIPETSKRAWTSVSDGQRTHKTEWSD